MMPSAARSSELTYELKALRKAKIGNIYPTCACMTNVRLTDKINYDYQPNTSIIILTGKIL